MQEPAQGSPEGGGGRGGWADSLERLRAFVNGPDYWRVALLAILILGASMRLTGVNWDAQTHLHPDERFLTDVETKLGWPRSLAEYFDEANSPLNPYNRGVDMFVYGTAPIFLVKGLGLVLDGASNWLSQHQLISRLPSVPYSSYWAIHLVGRVVSAFYDLAVVALVFSIGRRLYGQRVALLGAFLMACTVLDIQHAHYFTVETFITLMVMLAFFFTVRVVQDGGWLNYALMGASFGMAVAGKISVATYVLVMAAAGVLRALREPVVADAVANGRRVLWSHTLGRLSLHLQVDGEGEATPRALAFERGLLKACLGLALAAFVALLAFRVTQPYAFTGPSPFNLQLSPRWLNDVSLASHMVSGAVDMPPGHQWTDREPIWFAWRNMVVWGMGLPLGLAAWAGWLVAVVELVRKRRLEHLLLLLWVTFTFLYQSIQFVKVVRYFLPIYPLLVLLGAYFVVWLWRQGAALAARANWRAPAWRRSLHRAALPATIAVGVVVAGGTLLYAEAFTNIYRRPLSRVAASAWIYDNIPPGAALTWEEWDDILPVNMAGKDAGQIYNFVRTAPYWEDTPEKRDEIYKWLDEADYIIFSSNRLYDSIPRLPERYPLTTAYYKYLFSGQLGFEVYKVITSYPNLGPIQFVDDRADEAFTVYDHPKITILRKTPAYSSALARSLLGDIPVGRLVRQSPLDTMRSHHLLLLSAADRAAQQLGGTWAAMFSPDGLANRLPVPIWLLTVELLALAAWPLAYVAFPRFRDRGFIFAKALGILLVAYLAWLGASLRLVPYTRGTIAGAALMLLAAGATVAWGKWQGIRQFLRLEWRTLALEEGLYLGLAAAFLLVRLGNPDLWHPGMGGEKPMDLAYLNAIIKSTWFPPYDPWFAGGYINYYYFGQVIVATLCKLTGIVPTVAYNLALPTLFALTAMGGYSVVAGLLGQETGLDKRPAFDRATRAGLFGALLIAVLGNLGQVRLLLNGFWQASQLNFRSTIPGLEGLVKAIAGLYQVGVRDAPLNFRPEWWYWNASRVMGAGEINEFPFFTFLYADLHAHLIALPFALLALGLIVSLLRGKPVKPSAQEAATADAPSVPSEPLPTRTSSRVEEGAWGRLRWWAAGVAWGEWLALGILALVLGELRVNNTWDYPTYLLLALCGLVLARILRPEGIVWRQAGAVAGRFLFLLVASTLLYQPFHSHYGAAYTSVELWRGVRTSPGDYLVIHGVFLFILGTYVLSRAFGYQARGALARSVRLSLGQPLRVGRYSELSELLVEPHSSFQLAWLAIVGMLLTSALALFVHWWLVGLALPLVVVGMALVLRSDLPPSERFAALLFTGGLLLTVAVEAIVLRGDIGRMNTVFKFYLQVWVLWGVAAAVALESLSRRWGRWPEGRRHVWQIGLGLLLFGAALYPLTATWAKINDRFDRALGPGLDGTAYTRTAAYFDQGQTLQLGPDMEAIRWLQQNVAGSPVILEGNTPNYRWGSRVSIYTGLPTVVGWDWHEKQQRAVAGGELVDWRLDDVRTLYDTTNEDDLVRLLKLYDISYVYVGELERAYYHPEGLAKFDNLAGVLFDVVYRQGGVTIYQVRKESLGGFSASPFLLPQAGTGDRAPLLSGPVDGLPQVLDRGWNVLANSGPLAATAFWWLAISLLGWGAWPLCLGVCRGLPDRGYLLAKAVGWLLVGTAVWLGASSHLLANTVPTYYAALGALLLAGALMAWRERRQLGAFWRARRVSLLRGEALFSGAFLAFVLVRALNPDLWQPWFGGEKMMEYAYLNAITKSAHFPPYDPYFAGGYINYYYYGLYLVNVLIKLTGVVPQVAFNLAVPTFFALTVGQAFSFGHALTARSRGRRWLWGGVAAATGVAVLANLTVLAQWLRSIVALGGGVPRAEGGLELAGAFLAGLGSWVRGAGQLMPFDYWYDATRIIPFTINEFPFFSFLFADLHPHLMAMPFTVATLVLLVGAFVVPSGTLGGEEGRKGPPRATDARPWALGPLVLLALMVGALGPLNTWDLPTYLGLVLVVLGWLAVTRGMGWRGLVQALGVAGLAYALYMPFYRAFVAPSAGLRFDPNHTGLRYFLIVWGVWLAALYSWLGIRWWRGKDGTGRLWRLLFGPRSAQARRLMGALRWQPSALTRWRWLLAPATLLLVALALIAGEGVIALLVPLLALSLDLCLRPRARVVERLGGLLAGTGTLILAATELVFLADFLAGSEWQRMNTVFKFGIQAWVLLALAAAVGLPVVLTWLRQGTGLRRRVAWALAMAGLVGISLAYVPLGTVARVSERFPGGPPPVWTLDGLAYMRNGVYQWPDPEHPIALSYDYDAIQWLLANVPGTPVIAEAPLSYYREGGMRVSSYTGLPTLVGFHEGEQRSPQAVAERQVQAEDLYRSPDPKRALALMRDLRVQYVYFGQLEEAAYGAQARAKFDGLAASGQLDVAYRNPKVVVYRYTGPFQAG